MEVTDWVAASYTNMKQAGWQMQLGAAVDRRILQAHRTQGWLLAELLESSSPTLHRRTEKLQKPACHGLIDVWC